VSSIVLIKTTAAMIRKAERSPVAAEIVAAARRISTSGLPNRPMNLRNRDARRPGARRFGPNRESRAAASAELRPTVVLSSSCSRSAIERCQNLGGVDPGGSIGKLAHRKACSRGIMPRQPSARLTQLNAALRGAGLD
jgi:hypothetical protein